MGRETIVGQTVIEYLSKYLPETPTKTIARVLHEEHPELFATIENARSNVRKYRGASGARIRSVTINQQHYRPFETIRTEQFGLPDPIRTCRDPYYIPKASRKMLVINDIHIPYQDNDAVSEALEYGYKKGIDTLLLNGDIIDCFPISKFAKTGFAPRLEDEIGAAQSFLKSLREAFPNALIVFKFGNHEDRMIRYIFDNAPELEGLQELELDNLLRMTEYNIIPVKDRRLIVAGELNILHGHEYGAGFTSPVNPARTMFLKAKANILFGHFHQVSEHTGRTILNKQIGAWSVGHLGEESPDYRPYNEWMHGYAYVVLNEDGSFWVSNRKII